MSAPTSPRGPSPADEIAKAELRTAWGTDRAALIFARPFIATIGLRMRMVAVVDHRVRTACTDGQTIWFNPHFLKRLSPADRVFVLAHEIWHCVMLHPLRRQNREPRRWNLAIDQEVNALLKRDGFEVPGGAIYVKQLDGLSAEEVYQRLPAAQSVEWTPLDAHLEPGAAGHRIIDEGEDGGIGDEAVRVEDPDFAPRAHGREAWEAWPGRVAVTRAQLKARGLLSRTEDAALARSGDGSLDWRRILQNFVSRSLGGERVWNPPARRHVHRGLYLPSLRERHINTCVAIDTSGSTHPMLPTFLAELHGLLTGFGRWTVRILWADSAVQREELWTSDEPVDLDSVRVPLGGGTDFRPVFEHLAGCEAPDVLIYITDGEGRAPDQPPAWPVLWVLPEGASPPAEWGEVATFPAVAQRRRRHR